MVFLVVAGLVLQLNGAAAQDIVDRGVEFTVLRDVPAQTGIEDICCGALRPDFSTGPTGEVRTGYGETSLWLRLGSPAGFDLVQFSPILDDVTLFARNGSSGPWVERRTGDQVAAADRSMVVPQMVVPLPADAAGSEIYVRIVQPTAVTVSARFWRSAEFEEVRDAEASTKTFLLGFVAAIILYNLFVSLIVRDAVFAFNALCITSLVAQSLYLSGYGAVHVWAQWPGLSNTVNVASLFFSVVSGTAFIWLFLREEGDRIADRWIIFAGSVSAVPAAAAALVLPLWSVQAWMLLSVALFFAGVLFHSVRLALAGDAKARIMLVPLLFAMVPGLLLVAMEKLLGPSFRIFDGNGLELTLCAEAVLFSLALVFKIRLAEQSRRRADAALMKLRDESAERAIEVQEAERRRMAKELHDGVGQGFLYVVGNLKQLASSDKPSNWRRTVTQSMNHAVATLDDLRRILKDMYPVSLEHLGLAKSIHGLFENLETSQQIDTEVDLRIDETRLSRTVQLHIYRIIQECLANISHHSEASRCACTIVMSDDTLELTIEDDGVGPHSGSGEAGTGKGLGLTSIDQRVHTLSGDWSIRGGEVEGTLIRLSIPLAQ